MKNYASTWKFGTNLKSISYDDFVTMNVGNGFYIEKVDGMLGVFIFKEGEESFFQTTTGKQITNIPAISEYERTLRNKNIKSAIIPGELVARKNRKNMPFNVTQSIVKTFHVEKNKNLIYHFPYDIIEINGIKPPFKKSINFLTTLTTGTPHIIIPFFRYGGVEVFRRLYDIVKDKEGFDGVVARDIKGKDYKIKFTNTVDVVVIGIGEEGFKAWPKGQASYLLTSFIDRNGLFRLSSKVGTGFTHKRRAQFFDYAQKNGIYKERGVIYVPPKLIIEISFLRSKITKMSCYNFVGNKYDFVGHKDSITLSELSFQRLRTDKRPNKLDVRLEQIPEWRY